MREICLEINKAILRRRLTYKRKSVRTIRDRYLASSTCTEEVIAHFNVIKCFWLRLFTGWIYVERAQKTTKDSYVLHIEGYQAFLSCFRDYVVSGFLQYAFCWYYRVSAGPLCSELADQLQRSASCKYFK